MRTLLLAALAFALLVTPSLMYPMPKMPAIEHHPVARTLEYIPPEVERINDTDGFLYFGGQRLHFVSVGSGERVLFLPGYGGTAKETVDVSEEPGFNLIVIDPPGMGLSSGPEQTPEAFLGNGTVTGSYFRRYARYAYEAARFFDVSIVVGASLGGITTFLVGNFVNATLIPIVSSGFREFSLERGEAINRFVRDPGAKRLVDAFDPAVFAPYIRNPTYMIVGTSDEIFDVYAAYRTYELLGGPKGIVVVKNARHTSADKYAEALLAVYAHIRGEDSVVRVEEYYVGSIHEAATDFPCSAFGLRIVTKYNEFGPFESEISEYSSAPILAAYLAIIAAIVAFMRHIGIRRLTPYAGLLGFLPRAYSPGRFLVVSVPAIPRFLLLSALLLLGSLKRWRLGLLAYIPRLFLGLAYATLVLPGPAIILFIVAAAAEAFIFRRYSGRDYASRPHHGRVAVRERRHTSRTHHEYVPPGRYL